MIFLNASRNTREHRQNGLDFLKKYIHIFLEGLNSLVYKSEEGESGSLTELELQWGAVIAARAKQPNR